MKWLVLLHVLSAIIGIGPTYFIHVLYRKRQSVGELKQSLRLGAMLNLFPNIGGSIAVISGVVLVALSPVRFLDLWIIGSLVLYVIIQILMFAVIRPKQGKLREMLDQPLLKDQEMLSEPLQLQVSALNRIQLVITVLSIVLFVFMLVKPT
ncbi:DUF2269 family protein [Paenibacillus sp. OAS669]|uniref:DUF2269 family protein n=1 Tax=Paenibacillus sp. OAS669 TaxID=2663821 RepID=UPI001789CAA8|nr:DUF2269 family protein [Paenibacillus sp. OAS669]MBE1440645.1 putative membrane protein [Paenibacillus sp. OAS669]